MTQMLVVPGQAKASPKKANSLRGFPARELLHVIDPVRWAESELKLDLDEWQKAYLRSSSKRKVLNCCRQSGKSTIAAVKALHLAIHRPHSTILLLSPSLRQSSELFRKVLDLVNALPERPKLLEENKLSLTLANASRIVSLPSSESTIRGYSNVPLIIEDESAAVRDELHAAVLPMLAVSNGEIDLLSTPRGREGHFAESWEGEGWEKTVVKAEQVPRISKEFLDDVRKRLGSRMFSQEFGCEFLDVAGAGIFRREWFEIVDSYPAQAKAVRRWDKASTAGAGDFTAGLKLAEHEGVYYVVDVRHAQNTPGQNEILIAQTAQLDGVRVKVRMEEEGGSTGKDTTDRYARVVLKGFDFKGVRSTGDKVERAGPISAAAEAKNVKLVKGNWDMKGFLDELVSFPEGEHDDRVDTLSGAFFDLQRPPGLVMIGGLNVNF
jgi:predicted phage terminase large subunit-like protein